MEHFIELSIYCAFKPTLHSTTALSPWYNQWYPIGVVEDLDPKIIHLKTVLGKDLIFYKPDSSEVLRWTAAEDRAAPLSKGYINTTNENLVCRFYGWSFNSSSGFCDAIPQLTDQQQRNTSPTLRSNPRACLRTYPTRIFNGPL